MRFADRFDFPRWNLATICAIIAFFLWWEIWGAVQTHHEGATLTYLIRNTAAAWRYGRVCLYFAWLVVGWHFCWHDQVWWLNLCKWVRNLF